MLRASETPQLQSQDVVLTDAEPLSPSADPPRPVEQAVRSLSRVEAVVVALAVVAGLVLRFWTTLAPVARRSAQRGHRPSAAHRHRSGAAPGRPPAAVLLPAPRVDAGVRPGRRRPFRALSGLFGVATLPLVGSPGAAPAAHGPGWASSCCCRCRRSPFGTRPRPACTRSSWCWSSPATCWSQRARASDATRLVASLDHGRTAAHALLGDVVAGRDGPRARVAGLAIAGTRGPTVRVLVAVLAGGVFLLPWLPSMLYQSAHTGTPWAAACARRHGDVDDAGLRRRLHGRRRVARLGPARLVRARAARDEARRPPARARRAHRATRSAERPWSSA